jgi:hypothetical protein
VGKRRHGRVVDDLEACRDQGRLVRVERPDRQLDRPTEGLVVAVGIRWVVLARLHPDVVLDGHVAIRARDVGRVRVAPAGDWREEHLGTMPSPPPPEIDPSTSGTLFTTLRRTGAVVEVAAERRRTVATWVGVPVAHADKQLDLDLVDPLTLDRPGRERLAFGRLTRVEFGTRRLEAMAAALARRDARAAEEGAVTPAPG